MPSHALKTTTARQLAQRFPRIWMERELRFRPNHFQEEFWLVPALCDQQKTSVDIGANMGHFSYYMAKFSRNVIAFEPNGDLWPDLRRLLGNKVQLESAALSRTSSKAVIRIDPDNTGVSTIEEKNGLSCATGKSALVTREIETRTLDSFNLSNVALVKIDVEGHEEAVLEGARETLQRDQPALIIESEDRHNLGAPRRIAKSLAALGYLAFYLKDHSLCEFSTLRPQDTDPANLASGLPYITDFVFLSAAQPSLIDRVRAHLASRTTAPPAQSATGDSTRVT